MRGYPVYRLQAQDNTLIRIGSILEFRRSRRSMNHVSLLRLARKLFAGSPGDIVFVGPECISERSESVRESAPGLAAG